MWSSPLSLYNLEIILKMVIITTHKPIILLMVKMHWLTNQTSAVYTQVTVEACGPFCFIYSWFWKYLKQIKFKTYMFVDLLLLSGMALWSTQVSNGVWACNSCRSVSHLKVDSAKMLGGVWKDGMTAFFTSFEMLFFKTLMKALCAHLLFNNSNLKAW